MSLFCTFISILKRFICFDTNKNLTTEINLTFAMLKKRSTIFLKSFINAYYNKFITTKYKKGSL